MSTKEEAEDVLQCLRRLPRAMPAGVGRFYSVSDEVGRLYGEQFDWDEDAVAAEMLTTLWTCLASVSKTWMIQEEFGAGLKVRFLSGTCTVMIACGTPLESALQTYACLLRTTPLTAVLELLEFFAPLEGMVVSTTLLGCDAASDFPLDRALQEAAEHFGPGPTSADTSSLAAELARAIPPR